MSPIRLRIDPSPSLFRKMSISADINALVEQWIAWDPNSASKAEISALRSAGSEQELRQRLGSRIAFGTAGLRGAMSSGFANMNDLTVIQASQGLSTYILREVPSSTTMGVVIGNDGRHNSRRFAELTAATFLHKGFKVYLYANTVPTPLVAYGVTALGCCAGIVITASHNPKDDNGYKVYWSNGCQIVSPVDSGVTKCIQENLAPWPIDVNAARGHPNLIVPNDVAFDKYFNAIRTWNFTPDFNKTAALKITYTAMHGVGAPFTSRSFSTFGLPPFIPVGPQIWPDPDFPTVPFPNPEEGKGALKLSFETADAFGSPLVLANDPDADRLAAAEKRKDTKEWHVFTGDQLGILFADWLLSQYLLRNPKADRSKLLVLNTTVSSKMLAAFAKKEGLHYEETLTGFKWLGTKVEELRSRGYNLLLAYEEAIGYMVGDICLDKDGVRGAAVFAEMASNLYAQGSSCFEHLQALYERYGFFRTNNRYFFNYDPAKLKPIFADIQNGGKYHDTCGRFKIVAVRDLTTPGFDSREADKKPKLPTSSSPMITFYFENGAVATLRGSGTEPKLKYYVELSGRQPDLVQKELDELVQAIIENFLQPQKWNLIRPTD